MAWGPTAPLWSVRPAHPETWSLAQAMAILTLPKVQGPSVLSFFLSPHNRPVFVVCALWINLRDRCCNSLSRCCYSLVKRPPSHHHVQGGGNSPQVLSSYIGRDPVHWTSCAAPSSPTTENTVVSEGEDVAHIPAQEVTCPHGTDLGASLLSTRSSPLAIWQRVSCPGPGVVPPSCPSAAFECRYSPAWVCITVCETSPSLDDSCWWD